MEVTKLSRISSLGVLSKGKMKKTFLNRHILPVYMEEELYLQLATRSCDLDMSCSGYIVSLIEKDLEEKK